MKKILLSESAKALVLAFVILVSYAGNIMAQATVSEPDANGVVTITTTEAGQIGQAGNWGGSYIWNSEISESEIDAIKQAKGIKLVGYVNSTDIKSLVEGCKNFQNQVYWSVLDMGKAEFTDELSVDAQGAWGCNSHCFLPQLWYRIHATSLILPKLQKGTSIPKYFCTAFEGMRAVTIPEGYTDILEGAFGKNTFEFANLTFPSTIKNIEKAAFYGNVRDVYFLGKKAPKVNKEAFGSDTYYGNSGFFDPQGESYTATRDNYYNGTSGSMKAIGVLHLRSDLTAAERAAYTDITRKYHVFARPNDDIESSDPAAEHLEGATSYVMVGDKKFVCWPAESHNNYVKASAHYDTNLGKQYIWPNQDQMVYAYENAGKNLLWNGKSSIGDGIRNAGDKSYTGDGSEYEGLHEFVLVSYDVTGTKTPEKWGFDNIGEANWYTICIPVNMTVKQVRETFGEETQVCKFSKVARNSDVKVRLEFKDEQCYGKEDLDEIAIAANEAYMIRPGNYKDALTKFVFEGYEIDDKVAPIPTTIEVVDEGKTVRTGSKTHKYTFVGNYQNGQNAKYFMPMYSYYLGADKKNPTIHKLFFQISNHGKWAPYTCVVLVDNGNGTGEDDYATFFDDNSSSSNAKGCNTFFGADSSVTSIEDVEIVAGKDNEKVNANATIYDMNGRVISNNGDVNALPKGLYIQNGKKFIVR